MDATLILCDAAQTNGGKLYILGAGWDTISVKDGGMCPPFGLGILVDVPWDQLGRTHHVTVYLEDSDGHRVYPDGVSALIIEADLAMDEADPRLAPGAPACLPLAVNVGPLSLQEGRYRWTIEINGETDTRWQRAFGVVAEY